MKEHLKDVKDQAMYCVIHGGLDRELRKKSVDYLTSLPFDVSTERDSGRAFSVYISFVSFLVAHIVLFLSLFIYIGLCNWRQLGQEFARVA